MSYSQENSPHSVQGQTTMLKQRWHSPGERRH